MGTGSPLGSLWNRWDLHFHTPSSYDYEDKSGTDEQIVNELIDKGVRVVAITDHHVMDIVRINNLQKIAKDKLTILPGIELRSDQGGDPIHFICIFPEDCDLNHVWTTLQGSLGLTETAIREKGGNDGVYASIKEAADITKRLGGVITIHAGVKSNSIESIKNKEQFQQRIKFDITQNYVDLMEVGQIKDIDIHLNKIFPATGLNKPLIICSDNHKISEYLIKAPLWFRADPTFRGLLMVLREPQGRVFIGEQPIEQIRVAQNPTKYIKSISFVRKSTAPTSEQWFNGNIPFNTGLIAIVGNKGSGKSALADTLGLLGASKNHQYFPFLSKERFRHPKSGHASHFKGMLEWISGEKAQCCLADSAKPEELERLKYLPQDHVETVCNELMGIGERGFEQELKGVIFSHVPEVSRLGQQTLDELVRFKTGEKQKRIDSLLKQLRETSRLRALLEAQTDLSVKREIEEKIKRCELEIDVHNKIKPAEVKSPTSTSGQTQPDSALLKNLISVEEEKKLLEVQIAKIEEKQGKTERRQAVTKRLIEKIDNFQKEYDVFIVSLKEDAEELGLSAINLVSLTANKLDIERISIAADVELTEIKQLLDDTSSNGLKQKLKESQGKISDLQAKLDAPNRFYQAYLTAITEWQNKLTRLEGSETEPESLNGLKVSLASLSNLPTQIASLKSEQIKLAIEIQNEKVAQAEVYRSLYGPVQSFIDSHLIAKDKLKLEFRAELNNEDFTDRLLSLLALNRKGSFMGIDEGKARTEALLQVVNWENSDSVQGFLESMDKALHFDQRDTPPQSTQLHDQLIRGKKVEEVFNLLFGLEYVQPRYVLKWEGKELSMLSPGERGTLLLVFYLLIDKGDMPLLIDQPEGNLDNHTVAKILVDCIREARKKRQVFIVTHNPNLAVVCDADQIIYASMDKANGNQIKYISGALENPIISKHVTDVLEGTRWAFGVRDSKYEVGEK